MNALSGSWRPSIKCRISLLAMLLASTSHNLVAATYSHVNPHPEIQMYSYPAASANGDGSVRDRAATFAAFSTTDANNNTTFYQGSGQDPSRRGSFIAISNTAIDIPSGLDPARYQITSLKVKTTLLGSLIYEPLGYVLQYDNSLDGSLALTSQSDIDLGSPMEMYGLGLQGDYEAVSFEPTETDPQLFQLSDVRWKTYQPGDPEYNPATPNAVSPYQFFAVDANGDDVENAIVGGYSATAPGNITAQFTPEPFAIGKLYDAQNVEIAPGTLLKNGDTFTFEPNLSDPRIVNYLQTSLALGHLGFSFSSLHEPAGHEGTIAYPDFYLDKLSIGTNPNGAAPQIELQVNVLDSFPAGDYDRNGVVDANDLARWRQQFGMTVSPFGAGADGNSNGIVDAADYTVWRQYSGSGSAAGAGNVASIPEPISLTLLSFGLATILGSRRRHHNASSQGC